MYLIQEFSFSLTNDSSLLKALDRQRSLYTGILYVYIILHTVIDIVYTSGHPDVIYYYDCMKPAARRLECPWVDHAVLYVTLCQLIYTLLTCIAAPAD